MHVPETPLTLPLYLAKGEATLGREARANRIGTHAIRARSETESWKIASFNRLARRTVKIKLDKLTRSPYVILLITSSDVSAHLRPS
jgi:hypothetical protein